MGQLRQVIIRNQELGYIRILQGLGRNERHTEPPQVERARALAFVNAAEITNDLCGRLLKNKFWRRREVGYVKVQLAKISEEAETLREAADCGVSLE